MTPRTDGPVLVASAPGSLAGLARRLSERGWSVRRVEALRTVPVAWPPVPRWLVGRPPADLWVVTSRAVPDTFLVGHPRRLRAVRTIPRVVAVGPDTAAALRALGLNPVRGTPARGLPGLARSLRQVRGQRVLYLRSDRAGPKLARTLRRRGARVVDRVVYRTTIARRLAAPARRRVAAARYWVVSSPSALTGLRRAMGERAFRERRGQVQAFAIGPRTARALRAAGVRHVLVSRVSSEEGFTKFLAKALADVGRPPA